MTHVDDRVVWDASARKGCLTLGGPHFDLPTPIRLTCHCEMHTIDLCLLSFQLQGWGLLESED